MKTISTLLACIFLIFTKAWAQPYQSIFGTDSTRWHVYYDFSFASGYKNFIAIKPVIINNEQYQFADIADFGTSTFYLKEDTINGKVWASKHPDSTQFLIIDFSLMAGDTFAVYSGFILERKVIVDSTAIINGRKWIYFPEKGINGNYVYNFNKKSVFIEGIGTNYSHMMYIADEGYGYDYLLCAYKDGIEQTDYQNIDFNGSCDIGQVSTNDITASQILLYPNPTVTTLNISQLPLTQHTIMLYDITGRTLFRTANAQTHYQLDMQNYAPGTYILQVLTKEHATQTFKVMKY